MAQLSATQWPSSDAETYLQVDDMTGSVSTKVLTGSIWIKTSSSDDQRFAFSINATGINCFAWTINTAGNIVVNGWDSSGIARLKMTSDTAGYNDGSWHHVAFSFDLNAASQDAQLYIDGSSDMTTADTLSDVAIDFDASGASFHRVGIGVTGGSAEPFDGCLTEYWLGWEFVDLSSEIGQFYNGGEAVPLGSDGSTPTARQPEIFLTGGASDIDTNLGSGEDFTVVESMGNPLADCSDGPVIYSVTVAAKTVTRLGLYGGARQLYGDTDPKTEADAGEEEEAPSPTGGFGSSGSSGKVPRTYREDESEEERRRRVREQRERLGILAKAPKPEPERKTLSLPRGATTRTLGARQNLLSDEELRRLIETLEAEQDAAEIAEMERARRLRMVAVLLMVA